MTRLTETIAGLGIVSLVAAITVVPKPDQNGTWGVEPTGEVRRVLDAYLAIAGRSDNDHWIAARHVLRSSAAKTVHDARLRQNVQAVKAELLEEYEPGVNFGAGLPPRRYEVIIAFDGGKPLRWFYANRGPSEYRVAFQSP